MWILEPVKLDSFLFNDALFLVVVDCNNQVSLYKVQQTGANTGAPMNNGKQVMSSSWKDIEKTGRICLLMSRGAKAVPISLESDKSIQSPLKYQRRCTAALQDQQGFPLHVWSVHVLHVSSTTLENDTTWRCKRCHGCIIGKDRVDTKQVVLRQHGGKTHPVGSLIVAVRAGDIWPRVISGNTSTVALGYIEVSLFCSCIQKPCLGFIRFFVLNPSDPSLRCYLFKEMLE